MPKFSSPVSARYNTRLQKGGALLEDMRVLVRSWEDGPIGVQRGKGTPINVPLSSSKPSKPDVYTYSAPGMPMCPKCGQRPAVFYCSIHQSSVCLECVAKHDEPEKCAYVPAFRAPKPR